tara:strand:- start:523 stop:699 length:177 start_codon:yes stop_codon:yes gene_type:complete
MSEKSKGSVPQHKKEPKVLTPDEAFKKFFDKPQFEVTKEKGFVQNYKNGGIVNFKGTF